MKKEGRCAHCGARLSVQKKSGNAKWQELNRLEREYYERQPLKTRTKQHVETTQ